MIRGGAEEVRRSLKTALRAVNDVRFDLMGALAALEAAESASDLARVAWLDWSACKVGLLIRRGDETAVSVRLAGTDFYSMGYSVQFLMEDENEAQRH